ncbi:hypothetical protein [Winogradskyella sp. A3E31]|uniref:transglutaminase domain-containing protein n=1 Tax=Winogradskyella sp. A3E31 TaxID=3349637 RepID=UPI00398B5AC9
MRVFKLIFSFVIIFQSHAQISDFEHVDFSKADSIAIANKNESLRNLPELTYKLTADLDSDVEKFRSLFKWICTNLSNDYGLYVRNKRKRFRFKDDSLKLESWNTEFKKIIFKKMVNKKKTICTGYAYLLKELSDLAGLKCEIVHGFGKTSTTPIDEDTTPNHSWNVIELNGKWYLADPTWASGIPNPETNRFEFYFNEGYFLASPELFSINHFPLEQRWALLNEKSPDFQDFLDAPILYGSAYRHLTGIASPKKMHNEISKNENVIFNYQLLTAINEDQVKLMIDSGSNNREFKPKTLTIDEDQLTIAHRFEHTGFYDVHLLIDNKLVSTYTVKVNR